ncbi:TrbI/VirB10 family protein [Synergistaceae bacterium OttesenSCG-928-I11]|nr:TrbI/VirB10 family protein [Synergistaceae bacterium OttesenSCG-928-I11]
MSDERENVQQEQNANLPNGPQVARSDRKSQKHSKRVIGFFLLLVAALILVIFNQAKFNIGGNAKEEPEKNYRTPNQEGFRDLVMSMKQGKKSKTVIRSDPAPVLAAPVSSDAPTPPRIIINRQSAQPLPRQEPKYYSHRNDAQAASQLHAMKVQALVTKPVIDEFTPKESDVKNGTGQPAGMLPSSTVMPSSAMASDVPITPGLDPAMVAAMMQQQTQQPDLNAQARKQQFFRGEQGASSWTMQGYSTNLPIPQQFPYELKAGTLIPGILISGINSDLPGNIIGQVSENVWDTSTGRHVLIPKGTRVIGVYNSEISFGQRRVQVVWNRLIFPNGMSLNIAGSGGVDTGGYSGLTGRVNEHWGKMLGTALFASLFVWGAETVYNDDNSNNGPWGRDKKSPSDAAAESVANSILDMSTKMLNKVSDIQPTIRIRPGKKFGIFVNEDVVFPFPYEL